MPLARRSCPELAREVVGRAIAGRLYRALLVLSADEETSIQARCRCHRTLAPGQPRLRWLGEREALAAISFVWTVLAPDARSAVKHRPADVVAQPLVVKYELANRLRELVALPLALESPCGLTLVFWRGSACGLDRIGSRPEFVRGDVCDDCGLAGGVSGMPCCATQVSSRAHCMAARRAGLHHLDLATYPGAGMLDRLARPWILRLSRLEEIKDVLGASCRPQGEEMVIRISEGPTAADRHEATVPDLREDHGWHSFLLASAPHPRARTRDRAHPERSL